MKIPKTYKINKCRLCNSKNLKNIHNFGNISKYGFYLPSSLSLKNSEIEYISNCVNKIIN